ncbi:MAG: hypothetical protein ACR2FN_09360 [Chitinophagaceae bacterium]
MRLALILTFIVTLLAACGKNYSTVKSSNEKIYKPVCVSSSCEHNKNSNQHGDDKSNTPSPRDGWDRRMIMFR